jgi:hypothetical protein
MSEVLLFLTMYSLIGGVALLALKPLSGTGYMFNVPEWGMIGIVMLAWPVLLFVLIWGQGSE